MSDTDRDTDRESPTEIGRQRGREGGGEGDDCLTQRHRQGVTNRDRETEGE